MDEKMLLDIKKNVENDLKPFTYNQKILDDMDDVFLNNEKYHKTMLKVVVKDNKMQFFRYNQDVERITLMVDLLKKVQEYIDKNNKKLLDCIMYIYIANTYTYEYQNLPFFVLAKPSNRSGIIIPDETFIAYDVKGIKVDWDELKDIIKSHCNMEKYDKINKLYFRGPNAGAEKHNVRKLLEKERKLNTFYDITVGSYAVPIYENCKYKYLLNLPGHQPWSARFKYYLLMKSLMIHIDLRQHFEYSENEQWITFFGRLIEDKVEFVRLIYDWYEGDQDKNKKSLSKLIGEIKETYTYYEDNPDAYDDIVNNGFKKINLITLDLVCESIFILINEYAKKFN